MFCEEKIIKAYELREINDECGHYSLLQKINSFAYHTTEGYWLLFETENYYITIGCDGLKKYAKPYAFDESKYYINDDSFFDEDKNKEIPSFIDDIFKGQRIKDIKELGYNKYEIIFDDFILLLCVYEPSEDLWFSYNAVGRGDHRVAVGEHLLKKCECGGKPEIYLDEVGDFFIRCNTCHNGIYTCMSLHEAIYYWNLNYKRIKYKLSRELFFEKLKTDKIKSIVISNDDYEQIDERTCIAKTLLIELDDEAVELEPTWINAVELEPTWINEDSAELTMCYGLYCYNPERYSYKIKPKQGDIEFISLSDVYGEEVMVLEVDDTLLSIYANGQNLFIALAEEYENGNKKPKRTMLYEE